MLRKVVHPGYLVLLTSFASFLAWALPWPSGWRVGYITKERWDLASMLVLFVWYTAIAFWATMGFKLGRRILLRHLNLNRCDNRGAYYFISVLAWIGTASTYMVIIRGLGWGGIMTALMRHQANLLRLQLPYRPGLASLRYAAIPAAAVALARIWWARRLNWRDVVNLLSLIGVVVIASRLSLVMTTLMALGLIIHAQEGRRSARQMFWLGVALIIALVWLNWSRNAPFYRSHGVSNPWVAGLQETITYLGAPFQVEMGIFNHHIYALIPDSKTFGEGIIRFILPSYFSHSLLFDQSWGNLYRLYVDIEPNLTTNSVIVQLFPYFGILSFPLIWLVSFLFGLIAGHFYRYHSMARLIGYAALYPFAEIWRVYLFNAGIIHFVIIAILGSVLWGYILWIARIKRMRLQGKAYRKCRVSHLG